MLSSGIVIPCPPGQSRLRPALTGLAMIKECVAGLADIWFGGAVREGTRGRRGGGWTHHTGACSR